MRLLDRLKRWVHFPRSFEEVAAELADGLRDGTITLGRPEEVEQPTPDATTSPVSASTNGSAEPTAPHPSAQ